MPIPDAELPPIVENGDGLFSDLESDLARELRAARRALSDLIITHPAPVLRFHGGRREVDRMHDAALHRARALLPEEPSDEQS